MKNFDIFLKIEPPDFDKKMSQTERKFVIQKLFDKAKSIFLAAIKAELKNKTIALSKEQSNEKKIAISIKEDSMEEVVEKFRKLDVVEVIDSEFTTGKANGKIH
jgi:hypothetical protein